MINDPTHLDSARIARWFEAGAWTGEILPERLEAVCARGGDEVAIADGATGCVLSMSWTSSAGWRPVWPG